MNEQCASTVVLGPHVPLSKAFFHQGTSSAVGSHWQERDGRASATGNKKKKSRCRRRRRRTTTPRPKSDRPMVLTFDGVGSVDNAVNRAPEISVVPCSNKLQHKNTRPSLVRSTQFHHSEELPLLVEQEREADHSSLKENFLLEMNFCHPRVPLRHEEKASEDTCSSPSRTPSCSPSPVTEQPSHDLGRRCVRFDDSRNEVYLIPHCNDYTAEEKICIWTDSDTVDLNARENAMEWNFEGRDWKTVYEEDRFFRCCHGYLWHPAHWRDYVAAKFRNGATPRSKPEK